MRESPSPRWVVGVLAQPGSAGFPSADPEAAQDVAEGFGRPAGLEQGLLRDCVDVAQFIEAMLDGGKGELGSYFCGVDDGTNPTPGCRAFNGVVSITASWPGSLKGLVDDNIPDRAPLQASTVSDPLQPSGNYQNLRNWLPRQLCAAKTLAHASGAPNSHDGVGHFPIVGCDPDPSTPFERLYVDPAGPRAGVNAVRVVNGRDLSKLLDVQPQGDGVTLRTRLGGLGGLTIVSSLPVYVYGDWNVVSGPRQNDPTVVCPTSGALPPECGFPLTLVGGDRLTYLSRVGKCHSSAPGFKDSCARWGNTGAGTTTASQTFYFGAFMSGLSPTVPDLSVA